MERPRHININIDPSAKALQYSGILIASIGLISAVSGLDRSEYGRLSSQERELGKKWVLSLSDDQLKKFGSASAEDLLTTKDGDTRFAHPAVLEFRQLRKMYINEHSPNLTENVRNAMNASSFKFLAGMVSAVFGMLISLNGAAKESVERRYNRNPAALTK